MHEHGGDRSEAAQGGPTVILIGQPNVGKSVIFGRLTGKYAVVSNYPGTSVEVTTGQPARRREDLHRHRHPRHQQPAPALRRRARHPRHPARAPAGRHRPGRRRQEPEPRAEPDLPAARVRTPARALPEHERRGRAGRRPHRHPRALAPARDRGHPDRRPRGRGTGRAQARAARARAPATPLVAYGREIEKGLARIGALLPEHLGCARALGLMFLAGEPGLEAWAARTYGDETLAQHPGDRRRGGRAPRAAARDGHPEDPPRPRPDRRHPPPAPGRPGPLAHSPTTLGRWTREPATGIPIFIVVMLALYYFVGPDRRRGARRTSSRRTSSGSTSTRWWCACSPWCRGPSSSGCSPASSA